MLTNELKKNISENHFFLNLQGYLFNTLRINLCSDIFLHKVLTLISNCCKFGYYNSQFFKQTQNILILSGLN